MKYSGLQEDTYGVGLPQNRHPADMDVMMAATDDLVLQNEAPTEEGSIISNLPLLFADGYPTSLEKISLAQLERFVTFMVQCSSGYEKAEVISEPQWWSKEVKFSNPLLRPKKFNDNWMANLKKLVFRCYTYHRSEYLLRFCSYLARYPHEELEFVNNWDSTTSLYHKNTGKLLVTFRDENMNYDKKSDSPRKTLLSHSGSASNAVYKSKQQQHSFAMVQPPCDDIYLCDNCDAEFVGLEKMKEHERTCYEQDHGNSGSRPATPDLSITEPELGQHKFLEYFRLALKSSDIPPKKPPETNVSNTAANAVPRRTSNRVRGPISLTRSPSIPFSSPAGIMLAKKSKTMTEETQQERLERIERHSMAPPLTSMCRPKWMDREIERDRWVVTYRHNRDKPEGYVHQYNFNSFKGKPMLSIRSQLMYLVCRPVRVVLSRLSDDEIKALSKSSPKSQSAVTRVPHKRAGPASKTRPKIQPNAPTKRKATDEEEEEEKKEQRSEPVIEKNDTAVKIAMTTSALTSLNTAQSFVKTETPATPTTEKTCTQPPTSNAIMVIDLCSSDEDENNANAAVTSDENWDPMSSTDNGIKKALLKTHTPIKNCSTSCIYPANSTSDWLAENIFNDESENCANRCSSVVLNTSPRISPIIRPAP